MLKLFPILGWAVSTVICSSGTALAQDTPDVMRAPVIKLQIQRTNGAVETAAGLLVGKDQLNAYFITAYHAVEQNDKGVEVRAIQIQFQVSTQGYDAFVFEKYNRPLDLSVVRTAVANLPPGMPLIVRHDVALGGSVRIVGHPLKVGWSVWQGSVQKEYGPNDEPHLFVTNLDKSLVGGFSGGPVLDSDGRFVGMHTGTDPSYGIATKSKDIIDQLIAWRIPRDNLLDVQPESDLDAVKRLLHLYEAAYQQRDADALWKIWPNPAPSTKRAVEKSFPTARTISMRLQFIDSDIKIEGTGATVRAQFAQVFVPWVGDPHTKEGAITFKVQKNDGVWTLVDVK